MKKAILCLLCAALLLSVACIKITVNTPATAEPAVTEVTPEMSAEPVEPVTPQPAVAEQPTEAPTDAPTDAPIVSDEPDLSMLPWQHYVDWNADEETWLTVDLDSDGHAETFSLRVNPEFETSTILVDGEPALEINHGRYIDHVIFANLDPYTPYANLIYVIDWGSEDYVTYVLHLENGKLVQDLERNNGVFLTDDGMLVEMIQTDLLGTKFGTRQVAGEQFTPYSEWIDSTRIPTKNDWTVDREDAVDTGMLLHATRDIECTVDGQKSWIKTGTYLYEVRWNESCTQVEVCTEDGTHAMIAVELLEDEFGYEYLLYGVPQDDCFDNLLYAD